jgi:hypothetical protein
MRPLFLRLRFSGFLFQVRLQKTFCHLLNAQVLVPPQPGRLRQVEFEIAMLDGPVVTFAHITENKHARRNSSGIARRSRHHGIARCGNGESHGIPKALPRRPTAVAGITEVAERFQHVLRGKFPFVAGGSAVTAPSAAQRKPCRMRPRTVFQSRHRHEVRTGQFALLAVRNLLGLPIVVS